MRPLPFVWPYAAPFWAVYLWAFWPEFGIVRRGQRAAGAADAKSIPVYSYRIAVEERALLAAIGEPYRQFMSTRKRLIPFVY